MENCGLVEVKTVRNGNVAFARFWTVENTNNAIRFLKNLKNAHNREKADGGRITIERSTYKPKHHEVKEKFVNPDWKGWAHMRQPAPQAFQGGKAESPASATTAE